MQPRAFLQSIVLLGLGVVVGYWMGSSRSHGAEPAPPATTGILRPTLSSPVNIDRVEAAETTKRTAVESQKPAGAPPRIDAAPRVPRAEVTEGSSSAEIASKWRADVQQIQDPRARAKALAEIHDALGGTDRNRLLAALECFRWMGLVEYDKPDFHSLVERHLKSSDPVVKRTAIEAFCATGGPQSDAGPLLALVSDPDPGVRSAIGRSMLYLTREITDTKVEGIYVGLLEDKDPKVVHDAVWALCQTQVTEAVEDRLMELAKDPAMEADVCRSVAMKESKSDRVVDLLVHAATSSRGEAVDYAVRGLSNGLSNDQQARAVDEVVRSLGSATNLTARWSCFQLVERCGGARHIPTLKDIASNPMLDQRTRDYIERVIAEIERRKDG